MSRSSRLIVDGAVIVAGLLVAFVFLKYGSLENLPQHSQVLIYVWSAIAGLFFTSVLTVAPAAVVLAGLAPLGSLWILVCTAAFGAMVGDILILTFFKEHVAKDVQQYIRIPQRSRWRSILRHRFARWMLALAGAIVIASPLPDEIGLAMMGLSRVTLRVLAPVSFVLNLVGIYGIVWLALTLS